MRTRLWIALGLLLLSVFTASLAAADIMLPEPKIGSLPGLVG